MGVELSEESWGEFEREFEPMLREHLREIGGGELRLDLGLCRGLDAVGALVVVSARESGALVGYCLWTLGPSIDHAGEICAEMKPWYVVPEKRKSPLAMRLLKHSFVVLRARGIVRIFPHHWGNETLGKLFVRLGARQIEWVYEMELT